MRPTGYQSVEVLGTTRYCSAMIRPTQNQDLWVFGYGSLMWNPGFAHVEDQPGLIHGFHRSLCVKSTIYRGTPDNPGLVLGLDRGGSCCGRTFLVSAKNVNAVIAYLDEREQITKVYCPHFVTVTLNDGREVPGYTFVVRREHEQYVHLPINEQARLVAQGAGERGAAFDYLTNTIEHTDALGIKDAGLHDVLAKAQALRSA